MKKKVLLLSLGSILACTALVTSLALANRGFSKLDRTRGTDEPYSITINPDDITTSTSSATGQAVIKTDQLKNNVKFDFKNIKRSGDNLVILEDGFIANAYDSQIRSIKNVIVYGESDVFDYEYGWDAEGTSVTYVESDYSWASGSDIDLSSLTPNYIKFAYRAVELPISKIVIEYDHDCVVGENPFIIKDGLKYRKVGNSSLSLVGFAGASFANVVVPDTVDGLPVTEIAYRAFYYNTVIETIDLGANVKTIGERAFCYASNLSSVSSFANITHFQYGAFEGASSLSGDLVFPSTLQEMLGAAFSGTAITSVTFADTGNPFIGDGSLRSISTLESVHIGSEMNQFYEDFLYDYALEEITVGAGNTKYSAPENVLLDDEDKVVRSIAANRPQTSFTVPTGYVLKEYCAFGNKTLETLTLNESTDRIPDYSFHSCEKLHTINFGSYAGLKIFYAFRGCTGLTRLDIPSNVGTIYQCAFEDCENLETVVIAEGCLKIEKEVFKDCTSLKNVLLPSTLTSLGEGNSWAVATTDVFEGCTSLTKICTRLTSGTYEGLNIEEGWNGGRSLAYESVAENLDGNHYRMVDGTPRIWNAVSVTFKVYRTDIGTGYAIYFLGTFNNWVANEDSRGTFVSDHWELTIELVSYETYEFKGAVSTWDNPSDPVYEAGNNHSFTPDDAAYEYVINWQNY